MKAAFLGTPAAAVPSLSALLQIADVGPVVTRPHRPRGRGRRLAEPPVSVAAREWGLEVVQPTDGSQLAGELAGRELDIAVVVAYGRLLGADVLATTRIGFVNVHFSLLPRWRGAAPVPRSIVAGDEVTGVTLMQIDAGLDTGPVIAVRETEIRDDETGGSLTARLADLGAVLLRDVLPEFVLGQRTPAPQIEAGAVIAPPVTTDEARLDPSGDAFAAERMVRAFHPRPGAWISIDGVRIKILEAAPQELNVPTGTLEIKNERPMIGFASGSLELRRLQPAGRRVVTGREWARGRRGAAGWLDPVSG